MKRNSYTVVLVVVLAPGLYGCDRNANGTASPIAPVRDAQPPSPSGSTPPAFHVADVILSGVVFETTPNGRTPIAGVEVLNGEGNFAKTDANGFYSIGPLWVCPCAAQPWIEAGTTFLWVTKDGYGDPAGTPPSLFWRGRPTPGTRDVKIDGDTRFDIELVRQ